MKIGVFGKYPPIQGGVSSDVFEFVQAAVLRKDEVCLITNSAEVEIGVRAILSTEDKEFLNSISLNATIKSTSSIGRLVYVPYANPFLTKLIGLGLEEFSKNRPDFIIGWYLEPYGVAAAIVSKILDIPLIIKTAGSDIGKLSLHTDLAKAYQFAISTAYAVIGGRSNTSVNSDLLRLGANDDNTVPLRSTPLPSYFRKRSSQIKPDWKSEIEAEITERSDGNGRILSLYQKYNDPGIIDSSLPTIGVYGKIGEYKATYDLLAVFESMQRKGGAFNVAWVACGRVEELDLFFEKVDSLKKLVASH